MVWIWAGVFLITLILEVMTVDLVSIFFAAGSLVAFILSLCGVNETIQIVVFLIVSIVLLASLRAIFVKLLKNNKEKTNIDSIIGTVHTLKTDIKDETLGEVKLNGVVWTAVSKDGETIAAGEKVQIVEVQGNKLIVKKEKTDE